MATYNNNIILTMFLSHLPGNPLQQSSLSSVRPFGFQKGLLGRRVRDRAVRHPSQTRRPASKAHPEPGPEEHRIRREPPFPERLRPQIFVKSVERD